MRTEKEIKGLMRKIDKAVFYVNEHTLIESTDKAWDWHDALEWVLQKAGAE